MNSFRRRLKRMETTAASQAAELDSKTRKILKRLFPSHIDIMETANTECPPWWLEILGRLGSLLQGDEPASAAECITLLGNAISEGVVGPMICDWCRICLYRYADFLRNLHDPDCRPVRVTDVAQIRDRIQIDRW